MFLLPDLHTVSPSGTSDVDTNVSLQLANPLHGCSVRIVETILVHGWNWSRKAELAATAQAERSSDPLIRIEAERIAKRHSGVWRAANKLSKKRSDGSEVRSVVPVRADAGDATCPTWLEREGRKRWRKMAPLYRACNTLDHKVTCAVVDNLPRSQAVYIVEALSDARFREAWGIMGLDALIIPKSAYTVTLWIQAAFIGNVSVVPVREYKLEFSEILSPEYVYKMPYDRSLELGPEVWIQAHLNRYSANRDRMRDRYTYGCFYGKQAEEFVKEAAKKELECLAPEFASEIASHVKRISDAVQIVSDACSVGDKMAAVSALRFAKCYAEDAEAAFPGYPVITASLAYLSNFDISGLSDAPALYSLHEELQQRIWKLPAPVSRDSFSEWTCLELVPIHSLADIKKLAEWMRETNKD